MKRHVLFFGLVLAIIIAVGLMLPAPRTVAQQTSADEEEVKSLALESIGLNGADMPACDSGYQIGEYRQWQDWAFLTLVCWPAEQIDPDVHVPAAVILTAAERVDDQWQIAFEGQPVFVEVVNRMPKRLLNNKAKLGISEAESIRMAGTVSPSATTALYTTGLPWQAGQTWYYRTSIHGGNNALDLASPSGVAGSVKAADKGTVVWAYETCILIRRPDGLQIGYQHISNSAIRQFSAGNWVNKGQTLGNTTRSSGCGGNTYAHHVHFWLQGIYPNGSKFGGWTLSNPYLTKPGVSRYPSLSLVSSAAIYYNQNDQGGPAGYTFCANEGGYCSFSGTREVAYGAQGSFNHKYNVVGGISCNNSVFGDPLYGVVKACYYK